MQTFHFLEYFGRSNDVDKMELVQVVRHLPFKLLPEGPWLAGGALRRSILEQPLDSDYDFFFANEVQLKTVLESIKENEKVTVEKEFSNDMNVSMTLFLHGDTETKFTGRRIKVQLIKVYHQSPGEVLDSFDYTLCQFAFDGQNLICGDYALNDTLRKKLVVNKITFPVASMRRMLKYANQGFTVCGGAMREFLNQVVGEPQMLENTFQYID